jgi:hypothetical protein
MAKTTSKHVTTASPADRKQASPAKKKRPVNPNSLTKIQIFVPNDIADRLRRVAFHAQKKKLEHQESMSQICVRGILLEIARREKELGPTALKEAIPRSLDRGRRKTSSTPIASLIKTLLPKAPPVRRD